MAIVKRSMGSVHGLNSDLKELRDSLALKLDESQVINSLNSTDTQKPLSAAQGAALKDLIDTIDGLLASDDAGLDEFQEIVNYIKATRQSVESLGVLDIDGLNAVLSQKVNRVTGKGLSSNDYVNDDRTMVKFFKDRTVNGVLTLDCGTLDV